MIVLEQLRTARFMIILAKCDSLKSEIKLLGCMVGNGLVKPCHM